MLDNSIKSLDTETDKRKFIVRNLKHSFVGNDGKNVEVIKDINFSVKEKEFISIVGPSGCGKSTILNLMSGLLKPDSGDILLDGKVMNKITPRIGYISQSDSLMPWRTVLSNVELGMEIRRITQKKRRNRALELIAQADLEGFENAYPYQLSGGMRKRVDIIKVLGMEPEIIFMDEPFAALDVFTREMLQRYMLNLWQTTKQTIIFITHDLTEAITLSDRVIILTKRPATIKNQYSIDLLRPRSPEELRFDPEFIKLHKSIWEDLKSEVEM